MAFAVWFVQILIMLFLAGFKILYTIFKYPIFLDTVSSAYLVGYVYCYTNQQMDNVYSVIGAVIAGIITLFLIAKIKYIRLIPIMGWGAFWGYQFYIFAMECIKLPEHTTVKLVLSIFIGIAFLVWHIYAGIRYSCILGDLWDPIGALLGKHIL